MVLNQPPTLKVEVVKGFFFKFNRYSVSYQVIFSFVNRLFQPMFYLRIRRGLELVNDDIYMNYFRQQVTKYLKN
jgi:hypothetical protein